MREVFKMRMELVDAAADSPSVRTADHMVPVTNGEVLVRWYGKEGAASPGSAVVYYHGGGMVCGTVDLNDRLVSKYVEATGVPILSVDYRLAPEYPGTTLVGDGYAALAWFVQRADTFGVDKARIAVMGDSAGGGVAAGVAIAACDARTAVAKQILIWSKKISRPSDVIASTQP
jgi:acetyl esterase/lipase